MDPVEQTPFLPVNTGGGPNARFLSALLQTLSGTLIRFAVRLNGAFPKDGTEAMTGQLDFATFPVKPPTYTVAPDTRPAAASWAGGIIYVSDGGAGAVFQGSNGAAWVDLG